ncbi:MAG TPA: hypothetical protein VFU99_06105 [Gaiellaceae bacterium]|nr:hypothetical protein [Gaiellaceae bacterium]
MTLDNATARPLDDTILVTLPAQSGLRGVATMVLSGVGSRLDMPYERMDDLQLALLSLLDSADGQETSIEIHADDERLAVSVGPLRAGAEQDEGLALVLSRLTDGVETGTRGSEPWMTVVLERRPRAS